MRHSAGRSIAIRIGAAVGRRHAGNVGTGVLGIDEGVVVVVEIGTTILVFEGVHVLGVLRTSVL